MCVCVGARLLLVLLDSWDLKLTVETVSEVRACMYVGIYMYIYIYVLMRDERRKEERSKQGQTNNKTKQHSTPKAVTFPKKNELLNFLHSFLSACYLSSTYFYLSSTPFCVPVFIQLCLAWNRERVAL